MNVQFNDKIINNLMIKMLEQMNNDDDTHTYEANGCLNHHHNTSLSNGYDTNNSDNDISELMDKLEECKYTIQKLSRENDIVVRQLTQLEEQNMELIADKIQLECDLQMQRDYYDKRCEKLMREIEDLTRNIQSNDAIRLQLENDLMIKEREKKDIESQFKDLSQKLTHAEDRLTLMKDNEESLIAACLISKEKFNEMTSSNVDVIEELHETHVKCAEQNEEIQLLKSQIEIIKKHLNDKDNELIELKSVMRSLLEYSLRESDANDGPYYYQSCDDSLMSIDDADDDYNDDESVLSHFVSSPFVSSEFLSSQSLPIPLHDTVDECRLRSRSWPIKSKYRVNRHRESLFEELQNACPEFAHSTPEWHNKNNRMEINCDTETSRTVLHDDEHLEHSYFTKILHIISKVLRHILKDSITFIRFIFCINYGLSCQFIPINYQQLRNFFATLIISIAILAFTASLFPTNLPPYISWDEIVYRIFIPYVTKEKISKTQ